MAITISEMKNIPAPVLVINNCDDDDNSSSCSFSEEGESTKSSRFEADKNQEKDAKDSGVDCGPEIPFIEPDEETVKKIRDAVEYYLSDVNVLKDTFLLKHIRRNKEGYVSLKLISSFRKIKSLSRNWKTVAYSLRDSKLLALNSDGTKIRRVTPLPDHDETAFSRTVLIYNLPNDKSITMENINEFFSKCGDIALIRILKPGGSQPVEVKKFFSKHPDVQNKECGLIEFEQFTSTKKALAMDTGIDSGLRVLHLVSRDDDKTQSPVKTSPLRESPKKKKKNKRSQFGSKSNLTKCGDSESDASLKNEQTIRRGSFGYTSSSSSGYLSSSPGDYRFPRRHSYNPSSSHPDSTNSFASLNNRNMYRGSGDRLNKIGKMDSSFKDSSDNQCSWRRRRELLMQSESSSTSNLSFSAFSKIAPVKTIRLPFGPDGTKGFKPRTPPRLPSTAE